MHATTSPLSSGTILLAPLVTLLPLCGHTNHGELIVRMEGMEGVASFDSQCTALVLDHLFIRFSIPGSSLFPVSFLFAFILSYFSLNGLRKTCACVETVGSRYSWCDHPPLSGVTVHTHK